MNLKAARRFSFPTGWPAMIVALACLVPWQSRAQTTNFSFTNSTPIDIMDGFPANPSVSTISVPTVQGLLQTLTVTIYGLSDALTPGIELLMQGPTNQGIALMSDAGNGGANNVTITFADAAPPLPSSTSLTSGTFQPTGDSFPSGTTFPGPGYSPFYQEDTTNSLAGFIGTPLAGTWTLSEYYVNFAGSDGTIAGGWSLNFAVLQIPPTVTTLAASNVTATSATLNASVNPNGAITTNYFQYGTDTTYGQFSGTNSLTVALTSLQTNSASVSVQPGTTYHYRAVAQNSFGTNYGNDLTFATPAGQFSVGATLASGPALLLTVNGIIGTNYVVLGTTDLSVAMTPIVTNALTNTAQPIYVAPLTNQYQFFEIEQQ